MRPAKKFSPSGIHRHWKENAERYGQSYKASWTDQYAMELEVREITKRLNDGDRVLDAGCGNGFTTLCLASKKQVHICGIDYVPAMIQNGRKRLKAHPKLLKRVEFEMGDITRLGGPSGVYDKVVAVRVFINLAHKKDLRKALDECARVLKPRGKLLLSDATLEGWKRLNRLRREWGLPDIPMPPFNQYLEEKEFLRLTKKNFKLLELSNFSSTYFVGTRVLKPVLIQALGLKSDPADPLAEWNKFFSELPAWGDYGTQKLFVFEKK